MAALSRFLFILLLVGAALTSLIVSALNVGRIDVELAFVRLNAPVGVVLVVTFTLGLLAGLLWRVRWVAQLLGERGRLRRELRLAETRAREAAAARAEPAAARPQSVAQGSSNDISGAV